MLKSCFLAAFLLPMLAPCHAQHTIEINHTFYTNLFDTVQCSEIQGFYIQTSAHAAISLDKTNPKHIARKGVYASFKKDPEAPKHCLLKYPSSYTSYNKQYDKTDLQHRLDKGHVNPFEAMAFDETAALESMYYTNVCPQISYFNEHQWEQVEMHVVKDISVNFGDVKVWTGVLISNSHPKKVGDLMMPDWYWKVIEYTRDGKMVQEAWMGRNDSTNTSTKPAAIVTTVSHLDTVIHKYYPDFAIGWTKTP